MLGGNEYSLPQGVMNKWLGKHGVIKPLTLESRKALFEEETLNLGFEG